MTTASRWMLAAVMLAGIGMGSGKAWGDASVVPGPSFGGVVGVPTMPPLASDWPLLTDRPRPFTLGFGNDMRTEARIAPRGEWRSFAVAGGAGHPLGDERWTPGGLSTPFDDTRIGPGPPHEGEVPRPASCGIVHRFGTSDHFEFGNRLPSDPGGFPIYKQPDGPTAPDVLASLGSIARTTDDHGPLGGIFGGTAPVRPEVDGRPVDRMPEPSSFLLGIIGGVLCLGYAWLRRRLRAFVMS